MTTHDTQHDGGEREHADLVAHLHELGEYDRLSTPANLTDRLMLRTQANLVGADLASGDDRTSSVLVMRSRGWIRAAAAILIIGGGAAVYFSIPAGGSRQPTSTEPAPQIEYAAAEFNLELVDGSFWDDALDGKIDVLVAESTMLGGELDREWDDLDFLSDEGAL